MTEQNQTVAAPQAAAPTKKNNVWLWVIGGCLTIVVLIGVIILGLTWWGVRKVKREINKAQPNLEQWQKDAEEWSKNAEEWQKQAEEMQKNLPKASNSQ